MDAAETENEILAWHPLPDGDLMACGQDQIYLITDDGHDVTLTRWHASPDLAPYAVARQAARNAITLSGALGRWPECAAATARHLRAAASVYESGRDIPGYRSWHHLEKRQS